DLLALLRRKGVASEASAAWVGVDDARSRQPSDAKQGGGGGRGSGRVGCGNSVSCSRGEFVLVDEAAEEVESAHASHWRRRVASSRSDGGRFWRLEVGARDARGVRKLGQGCEWLV